MDSERPLHRRRWQGLGASPGIVTGKAHIIRTESDFASVEEQDILVARHATPMLFPCLLRAHAAVCETGGLLNHLAVLARELGKPCVTGLPGIVDAVEPGEQLCVDGTNGVVECLLPAQNQDPLLAPQQATSQEAMVPVLQFGLFSAAFEHTQAFFDIETAIRTAALVSVPEAFGVGSAWNFTVSGNRILVAAECLRETADALVSQLESGSLKSAAVRQTYLTLNAWQGWSAFNQRSTPLYLYKAVCHYMTLNQITWAAAVAKEPLSKRYHTFLSERLANTDDVRRVLLFLDSLIMPDHSYILRSCLKGGDRPHVWSTTFTQTRQSEMPKEETVAMARALTSDARHRYLAVMQDLERLLNGQDFRRAMAYISMLADLVDLTERKNTDLYRCGAALFDSDIDQDIIARLCGISPQNRVDYRSEKGCQRLVKIVLETLQKCGEERWRKRREWSL